MMRWMPFVLKAMVLSVTSTGTAEWEFRPKKPEEFERHPVFVNQSGYTLEWPKRFTAPLVKDEGTFMITEKESRVPLYSGRIRKGIGDFSDFNPTVPGREYTITVSDDSLPSGVSDPFQIESGWFSRVSLRPALQFMIDCRSVVGSHPSAFGGCPWRDGTYYSYEVPSLVMLYLAYPDYFNRLPAEIDYQEDKKKVLDPRFSLVKADNDQGALETARRYFQDIEPLRGEIVPDIVRLIHWGIGWYLIKPNSHDPSGDELGDRIHSQTVEQFAFFLYGFPAYEAYFTEKFYREGCAFAFGQWEKVGLFNVDTNIGTFKGRHCPGHSIMPNLMMFEVAKRLGRSDAKRFMEAAQAQTQWIIDELDWNDPVTTKGQRMSEHKLMTGLVFFLKRYPQFAPMGLEKKIDQWVEVMIARSDNLWDFRRYNDQEWALPRFSAGSHGGAGWNEVGNVAGFPAVCLAAASAIDDPAKKQRLLEIAVAHFDDLFGRNPIGAHSANHGPRDFFGVERGWPKKYQDNICARLELVRGSLSSSCGSEHYPFDQTGDFRHPEGWVAFNAAFNVSLAYVSQPAGPIIEDIDHNHHE